MLDKEKKEKIKKIIREFFNKMTREETPEDIEIKDNVVSFELKTETPEILIGRNGQVLINTQYLLSKIIYKQIGEKIFVDFDINQYKKKKTDYLKEMTKLENCNLYNNVLSEVEKSLITIVLKETGNNQLKAAKTLGINRNTLRAKIKEYKIRISL